LFERWWRLPVEGILFFFGLVNAGVPLHGLEAGSWGLPVAAVGRPIGIVAAVGIASLLGLHLPARVGWRHVVVVGTIASIGLIFALFFATAVMAPGTMLLELRLGALITIFGGVFAVIAAKVLCVGRFGR
jgi:Na+/H+ antiporter